LILGVLRKIAKRAGILKLLGDFAPTSRAQFVELFGELLELFL
jgi:hypothetical protein